MLGKDPHISCVTTADLFFADGRVSVVYGDEEGVLRILEYDPHGAPFVIRLSLDRAEK